VEPPSQPQLLLPEPDWSALLQGNNRSLNKKT